MQPKQKMHLLIAQLSLLRTLLVPDAVVSSKARKHEVTCTHSMYLSAATVHVRADGRAVDVRADGRAVASLKHS
jgi:hypothetical protein